ncbi:hypothetical protein B5K11_26285 [Rhizobium leguminosarum bv. trifolii]|uniref:trypsin-like serine protease n=1 Tax=Rhizobium leguminosarum TaxID=384 RepID=UPI000E2EA3CE|nr:trypsin-like serine protease [Rhizobium leguminosarum]RFB87656.1 hypothetical protein B5K11_26285 [Rhizobium leguminosarum bv. trifolii]
MTRQSGKIGGTLIPVLVALLLLASLISAPAQAQEDEEQLQIGYSGLSLQGANDADQKLASDIDAMSAKMAETKKANDLGTRIADGTDVVLGNFQEVIRIHFSTRWGENVCTGVLLSNDAILTAGHCGCGSNYRAEIQYQRAAPDSELPFIELTVSAGPVPFPGYDCRNPNGTQIGHDLALLRIVPLTLNGRRAEEVGPPGHKTNIELDFPVIRSTIQVLSQPDLKSLYIVGFGATERGKLAANLQGANVGLISRHCARGRVFASYCAMFREFALGRSSSDPGSKSVDSCGGDSGGPAYRMDTDATFGTNSGKIDAASRRTLVGIVSRALNGVVHPYPGYCGGGGIYTAVGTRPVLDWLRSENVAFLFDPDPIYQPEAE